MKKTYKAKYITFEQFESFRKGKKLKGDFPTDKWVTAEVLHASLSRLTYTTSDDAGNLFATYDTFLHPSSKLTIYARVLEGWEDKLHSLIGDLAKIGYGRDASVGLGAFTPESFEPFDAFSTGGDENGFMALSSFCPAKDDPTDGYYKIEAKYGKVNFEPYSSQNPFKKPILHQVLAGAVFRTNGTTKQVYGRVVENVAPGFSSAVQLCYCMPVPVRVLL